jgi:hypothetical protein
MEFEPFPKIPRLNRDVIVTEKIDGTNAAVVVNPDARRDLGEPYVCAQSRKRVIVPGDDNFGFATWVRDHEGDLMDTLGPGRHFGEWWGKGIQRGYGLDHKRFSLFNTTRWADLEPTDWGLGVVPELARGQLHQAVDDSLWFLRTYGSAAAPGHRNPEGIIVYHTAANQLFKVTLENDEEPKGAQR